MKKVLFLGLTDYDLSREDKVLEKKFKGLGRGMEVYVLARGHGWGVEKYGARFYLIPRRFGKLGLGLWLFEAFGRAYFLIKKQGISVIVTQSPAGEGAVGAALKILTGRELIVEVHGDWIESPFLYHRLFFAKIIKRILVLLGKFSLKRADKIRVISKATEKLAKTYAPKKPYYCFPTFTDIDIFKAETDLVYEPIIMYAGWLYRLKGVQFLIQAFARIEKKYPQFKLVIVGDGPYRPDLEKLAQKLGVRNIEFTGRLPLAEVKEIMRRISVFVLPSLSEGLGRVLLEAGMLAKPAIGSRVGGIPDLIKDGETGFLFTPGNVDELAEKLERLLGEAGLVKKMGEAARKFIEDKFSTEKYFQEYIKMVEDIGY